LLVVDVAELTAALVLVVEDIEALYRGNLRVVEQLLNPLHQLVQEQHTQ
jgi:hypothetical protein